MSNQHTASGKRHRSESKSPDPRAPPALQPDNATQGSANERNQSSSIPGGERIPESRSGSNRRAEHDSDLDAEGESDDEPYMPPAAGPSSSGQVLSAPGLPSAPARIPAATVSYQERVDQAFQVEHSDFDTSEHERLRNEIRHGPAAPPSGVFQNDTRPRLPDIPAHPPPANPHQIMPPPVREPGSLRVPSRIYQNIEGVPHGTQPFLLVPPVHYPVNANDDGFGPDPGTIPEAARRAKGINNFKLPPAALRERLMNHGGNLKAILKPTQDVSTHALWSNAPPNYVDISAHLGSLELTAVELMTFFPAHRHWHAFYHRLWENGWNRGYVTGYINWARDCSPPDFLKANTLATYVKHVHKTFHTGTPPLCSTVVTPPQGQPIVNHPVTDFTVQSWTPSEIVYAADRQHMTDYPVIELARGVPLDRLPTGDDRRLLTRVVEEVIRTNDHDLMLSQVQDYVVANDLGVGLTPMPANADQLAAERHEQMIKDYRADIRNRHGHDWQ